MALSDYARDQSPRCEVIWDGFRSNTWTLASNGWRASVEREANYWRHASGSFLLTLMHPRSGLVLRAESLNDISAFHHRGYTDTPVFVVREAFSSKSTFIRCHGPLPVCQEIDMLPEFTEVPFYKSGIFRDIDDSKREELVVAPETVAELMDRIRRLQEPELKAIRERNRARDVRERPTETVHAQIISIAA